ncbi:four-carbon acid sugar kinase family protein [Paraburkholderia phenoliruptrix]|uniref:four-carbon acid sugar kinase family protein n=1 Tax=Paraburkholderia phenoliruptrix TaxID=252970 RepID=UPI00286990D5|nr:four-carbon acid sugar kinase family protein [Paraburkholderia phenoliruptrix]WMY09576.1 four-carbon acid sugar kinase family protein [Paraburkholderia phenoliruptrix]
MSDNQATHRTKLRLAYYGDDFTGSTDALEVLAFAGLRCALFLKAPTRDQLAQLGGFDAIGVAGDSRAMSPVEMAETLPPVLRALRELDAPILHYKVCSTFDSGPSIGSIGKVIELARDGLTSAPIPIIAGTPALKRYCAFGNLFARSGTDGQIYRIDRHPIMSAHPVTPMSEGDLLRHLGMQTTLPLAGFFLPNFDQGRAGIDIAWRSALEAGRSAILLDTCSSQHLTEVGRLLETYADSTGHIFTVGSSGVEYALTQWWREVGSLPPALRLYDHIEPAKQILALSGSASPLSAAQIDAAVHTGFADIAIDAEALVQADGWKESAGEIIDRTVALLRDGRSVVMHTARGPKDPRIATMLDSFVSQGMSHDDARHLGGRLLGQRLGVVAQAILEATSLGRLVLSGGDTSSQVTQVLGPDALEIDGRLAAGAPLCRVISDKPHLRNLQLALKGGQMGDANFFVIARDGTAH